MTGEHREGAQNPSVKGCEMSRMGEVSGRSGVEESIGECSRQRRAGAQVGRRRVF